MATNANAFLIYFKFVKYRNIQIVSDDVARGDFAVMQRAVA